MFMHLFQKIFTKRGETEKEREKERERERESVCAVSYTHLRAHET